MSSTLPVAETDVNTIRDLIIGNIDIARGIRTKSERLHCGMSKEAASDKPDVANKLVGQELIDRLYEMRTILNEADEALTGFNG
ncbi:MAG: hypothetical protein ACTSPB_05595 [Candidatus Thorarchaeota archaeon]